MRRANVIGVALLVSMVACLDTPAAPDPEDTPSGMSATIDGTAWFGKGVLVTPTSTSLTVAGGNPTSNAGVSFVVRATTPGTYSLGPDGDGSAIVAITTGQVWSSGSAGGSGTITITTLASNHVAGTFSFNAVGVSGGAAGTVHVTNGKFDVQF